MKRYYLQVNYKVLAHDYALKVKLSEVHKFFPPAKLNGKELKLVECELCGSTLEVPRPSREDVLYYFSDCYCPKCGHRPYNSKCQCEAHRAKKADATEYNKLPPPKNRGGVLLNKAKY